MKRVVSSLLFAFVASFAILGVGVTLVPDTATYAHGGAAWSSPIAAAIGGLYGIHGIQLLGVAGAAALGYFISPGWSVALILGMAIAPHFPGLAASPDAAGAAACAWWIRRARAGEVRADADVGGTAALICTIHLVAGLCALAALALRRLSRKRVPWALCFAIAGCGAIAGEAALGYLTGRGVDQLQTRYLLPAAAVLAVRCRMGERRPKTVAQKGTPMLKRFGAVLFGALSVFVVAVASAGATSSPPAAPDFTNAVNTYGTTLANGLMPLLLAVLGVAAVFTLYKIGTHAIKKWIGRGKATNAI